MGAKSIQFLSGLLAAFFVDLEAAALVVAVEPPICPLLPPLGLELGAMLLGA